MKFVITKDMLVGLGIGAIAATGSTIGIDAVAAGSLNCSVAEEMMVDAIHLKTINEAMGKEGWRELYCVSDGREASCKVGFHRTYKSTASVPEGASCQKAKK